MFEDLGTPSLDIFVKISFLCTCWLNEDAILVVVESVAQDEEDIHDAGRVYEHANDFLVLLHPREVDGVVGPGVNDVEEGEGRKAD